MNELDSLKARADRWQHNTDKAWVKTPLGEIRALLDRIESAENALKVYGETCDYDDGSEASCRYEPHMCCKSARAHLSQYGERT